MQTYLAYHLQCIMITQLTVKDKIDDLEGIFNLRQQLLDLFLYKTKRWAEVYLATIAVLAPFGTPARATRRLRFCRHGLNRHLHTLVHLFRHDGVRRAALGTEQR